MPESTRRSAAATTRTPASTSRCASPATTGAVPKLLAAGRVDFAILDIHDLGIAREQGLDLVGAMAIVQRPLAAIIARAAARSGAPATSRA